MYTEKKNADTIYTPPRGKKFEAAIDSDFFYGEIYPMFYWVWFTQFK